MLPFIAEAFQEVQKSFQGNRIRKCGCSDHFLCYSTSFTRICRVHYFLRISAHRTFGPRKGAIAQITALFARRRIPFCRGLKYSRIKRLDSRLENTSPVPLNMPKVDVTGTTRVPRKSTPNGINDTSCSVNRWLFTNYDLRIRIYEVEMR